MSSADTTLSSMTPAWHISNVVKADSKLDSSLYDDRALGLQSTAGLEWHSGIHHSNPYTMNLL